ncbi:MAG TPA: restriction endonuclease subunit S [Paludibacter sp.]|nr:restriction endonuclease subunit S [Paludibacter sp.]
MTDNNIPLRQAQGAQHWQVKKLGEVCQTTSGGTPSRGNKSYYEGTIPWVKSGELDRGLILDTEEKISEEAVKKSSAKVFPKGTLLIALYGATIGKLAFLGVDAATNQAVCGIYKNENIDSNYLYYYLFSKKPSLVKQGIGGAQPNISQGILKNLDIPFPPLSEQLAIVSKIEELLSDLENGKQQLLTAQQQLKVYRQSLLKAAFEGHLTNKVVKEGELPKGWKWVKIEDIATVGTGATPLKGNNKYYNDGKVAWVTSGALNDEFVREATDYVTELALKETNLSVYPKHTLLLAMYGEGKTRGKCSELLIEATTNQAIAAIHFKNHDITVKPFLKYFLLKNYNDIRMLSSGGVQPNLNLGIVKKTLLPFPTIEEQHQIVEILESKLTVCDKIEETISQSLLQAESLKQSILKKAFEGKLA